jgi:hypothetical protein
VQLRPFGFSSVLLLALASFAPNANADAKADAKADGTSSSAAAVAAAPAGSVHWYGGETLLADGLSVGLIVLGEASRSSAAIVGLAGYVLGGPIVHAAHGRVGIAFADLALRLGAPLLMGVVGGMIDLATSGPCREDLCLPGLAGAAIGVLAGHVTAVTLDAAALAYEPASPAASLPRMPSGATTAPVALRLLPSVAVGPQGVSAGLAGSF